MAGPAIGINLITAQKPMYSSHYHYDDVASTLLFIAVIISLSVLDFQKITSHFKSRKLLQSLLVIWFMFFMSNKFKYFMFTFTRDVVSTEDYC